MKRRILTTTLILVLALTLPITVFAQDYFFSLDKEVVNVYWNSDGTLALDYLLTFTTQPSGHTIEFVDVGMPNSNFDFNSIKADINGQPLSISSDFQGTGSSGFAVEMSTHAIPPGQSGTVHVAVGRVTGVLYKDSDDANYASAVFAPLYFESGVLTGTTDLTVTYHLPPGVQPAEPRWHAAPAGFPSQPTTAFDPQGRITYTWRNPSAFGSQQYTFGASFPKSYVPANSIVTVQLPSISGDVLGPLLFFCFLGIFFLGIPLLTFVSNQRRKLQYMSPRISIEGHGIKRGLTAVEAAILLEQPLDKVMTMILFGVIKKNAASVKTRDPLELDINDPFLKDEQLHEYEKNFLRAFKNSDSKKRRVDLQDMSVALIKSVSEKMKGFSRGETVAYYKSIMEKAWQQVEAADTPEVKSQKFDEALEWTMLDRDYDDRTRRVFRGPIIVPQWWGRYDPAYPRSAPLSGGMTSTPMSMPAVPHLPGSDFASSVATGVQTFSQKVIGNVTDFTSRVTNVTNPPPKPSTSSYSGRGGGSGGRSCACACACAGCACACAGGGR